MSWLVLVDRHDLKRIRSAVTQFPMNRDGSIIGEGTEKERASRLDREVGTEVTGVTEDYLKKRIIRSIKPVLRVTMMEEEMCQLTDYLIVIGRSDVWHLDHHASVCEGEAFSEDGSCVMPRIC